MGEIKSTLELVMEKTKNLSLSSEERKEQIDKEVGSRIRGLLQKLMDQVLNAGQLRSEYQKLQKDYGLSGTAPLIREICGQIELGKDSHAWFELLAQFKVAGIEPVTSVLHEFDEVVGAAAAEQSKILLEKLAAEHFISGPAVVPNLEADPGWQKKAGEIRSEFEPLLDRAKTRLLSGYSD